MDWPLTLLDLSIGDTILARLAGGTDIHEYIVVEVYPTTAFLVRTDSGCWAQELYPLTAIGTIYTRERNAQKVVELARTLEAFVAEGPRTYPGAEGANQKAAAMLRVVRIIAQQWK